MLLGSFHEKPAGAGSAKVREDRECADASDGGRSMQCRCAVEGHEAHHTTLGLGHQHASGRVRGAESDKSRSNDLGILRVAERSHYRRHVGGVLRHGVANGDGAHGRLESGHAASVESAWPGTWQVRWRQQYGEGAPRPRSSNTRISLAPLPRAHDIRCASGLPSRSTTSMAIDARVFLVSALAALATAQAQPGPQLIPRPREVTEGAVVSISKEVVIRSGSSEDDRFTARDLSEALRERGFTVAGDGKGYTISLLRLSSPRARQSLAQYHLDFSGAMEAEGYALVAGPDETVVIGATPAGVFYGAQTVKQLIRTDGAPPRIQRAVIRDWPAMKYRGLHGDLSRGPVPTLEYQMKQIRTFAAYKLNVYSPYFEHTLEYRSNPLIAPPGGAMSREDVRALVAYAQRYHVDVIPEQEAFGHLHHVLKYELYAPLGETEHGHVLAPGDLNSLPLIKAWFAEIDSLFPSHLVHLGADETFELGLGRTRDRVQRDSLGPVYIDFLKQIERALRHSGKRFLFWGDIAQGSPALVQSLPKDMIAVAWGYGSNPNPERLLKTFVDAGMETWVSPGVNGWNRVYPNNDVTLRNIQAMAKVGQQLG